MEPHTTKSQRKTYKVIGSLIFFISKYFGCILGVVGSLAVLGGLREAIAAHPPSSGIRRSDYPKDTPVGTVLTPSFLGG